MIEPGPGAPSTPHELTIAERNAFMESLAMDARSRFLSALTDAKERGMSDQAAWEEAVVAAETTYNEPEILDETIVAPDGTVLGDETLVASPDPEP